MAALHVRAREEHDLPEVERFLSERHSARVARLGRLEDSLAHPALVAERDAGDAGCTRLWLITTNDNVDALRFYQRRGFRLVALDPGAVDDSRARLKPEIPRTGEYGVDLRDELQLEKVLAG